MRRSDTREATPVPTAQVPTVQVPTAQVPTVQVPTVQVPTAQVPPARGRPFVNGNSGRKRGSKNRTTLVAAALLEGEAEGLVRTAVALAKAGDIAMLKFLLSRILPRERLIKLDLPSMEFADDAVEAIGHVTHAVSEGQISPSEGAALATLVNAYTAAIDMADVVKGLDSLEAEIISRIIPRRPE